MICAWTHTSSGGGGMVYPDGCRDVILRRPMTAAQDIIISPFDSSPRWVVSAAGTVFEGYRLPPGATLQDAATPYLKAARSDTLDDVVRSYSHTPTDVSDTIEALAERGVTVAKASHHMGMPVRRLERLMQRHGQPSPAVWQQLARARRSVVQIAQTSASLAEVAADEGFSDQAHLTRALRRWFGITPGALRRDPALQARLCQPGLGTAAQTSIR